MKWSIAKGAVIVRKTSLGRGGGVRYVSSLGHDAQAVDIKASDLLLPTRPPREREPEVSSVDENIRDGTVQEVEIVVGRQAR